MHRIPSKRRRVTATFIMMLLVTTLIASLFPKATATPSPVEISIDPTSGPVGTTVNVTGNIDNPNGSYRILFDEEEVKNGTATETAVNDTFRVPLSANGDHSVTLYDVANGNQSSATFTVTTSYYVSAEPARIQEGLNTTITVGVNGAEENTTYSLTINVTDPQPTPEIYTATLTVSTDGTGSGSNSTRYYGNFPAGANTNYVGTYAIAVVDVNETLTTGNFTVGLTDATEYSKFQVVDVRATGYQVNESVWVNITFVETGETVFSENCSAMDSVVETSWEIPLNASTGLYNVTVTSSTTIKPVPDTQNFTVIEIIVYCQAQNKYDKEPLPDVTINVAYPSGQQVASGKTNKTGWVNFSLDRGNYTFKALWKGETVGALENQSVTGNATEYVLQKMFNITCELAHITIAINDEDGLPLPFINVTLTSNTTGLLQFETDYTGIIATNTFTNISYTIEGRRYGHLFNRTLIENLTFTLDINITCPTCTLFANVLDSKELPLQNVQMKVYEWGSERFMGSKVTNNLGNVTFGCTFGRYRIRVYDLESGVILNETIIDLIEDPSVFVIHCRISNVDLSVIVNDYFGHPIPNAEVKVEREGVETTLTTESNGMSSKTLPFGGNCRISVYVRGELCETITLYLDETKTVVFKLDRYVMVAGYPLEITQFITCISFGILAALFALALIYRRFRTRKASERKEKSL